jgi:uncharacterized membrane protein
MTTMPDIGFYHPQIVHFAVALLAVGVLFRWISLTGKAAFTRPAAATLLLLGTLAALAAVHSGTDAHDVVERVPGVRQAVVDHEHAADGVRTVFLIVAGLEIVGLALIKRAAWRRYAEVGSALVGLWGGWLLYDAAHKGGELVYAYAGGIGIRSGNPEDVSRLLTAGLYEQAMLARKGHRAGEADSLISQLARRNPADVDVQLVAAQSLMEDRKDPQAALAALDRIVVPDTAARMKARIGMAKADAFVAAGMTDSARAIITRLVAQFPTNTRVKDRLAKLR